LLLESERIDNNLSDEEHISMLSGYGYFDAGGVDSLLEHRSNEKRGGIKRVGKALKPVNYS
jgi:hypothetical protein